MMFSLEFAFPSIVKAQGKLFRLSDASTRQELQIALESEFIEISNWYADNRLTYKCQEDQTYAGRQ